MENLNIEKLDSDIIPFTNNLEVHQKLKDKKISQPYLTKYEFAKIVWNCRTTNRIRKKTIG